MKFSARNQLRERSRREDVADDEHPDHEHRVDRRATERRVMPNISTCPIVVSLKIWGPAEAVSHDAGPA